MEMDQISLQTLDRASIDIRRTLLHLSDLLILLPPPPPLPLPEGSLFYAQGTHIWARKTREPPFVVYMLPFLPPPEPRLACARARAHVCDVSLENSPVTRIHQESAKYRV